MRDVAEFVWLERSEWQRKWLKWLALRIHSEVGCKKRSKVLFVYSFFVVKHVGKTETALPKQQVAASFANAFTSIWRKGIAFVKKFGFFLFSLMKCFLKTVYRPKNAQRYRKSMKKYFKTWKISEK